MTCRDYERAWNERLDARGEARADLARALDEHASSCPACRAVGARYQVLSQAITALGPLPGAPAGFADRVLAASAAGAERPSRRHPRPWLAGLAAAAAVVAAVALGLKERVPAPPVDAPVPVPVARVRPTEVDPGTLSEVLAVAGSATWALAREASAPAARVGREVIASAELAEPVPSLSLPEDVTPGAEPVWQSIGERVNAGVRPLEGSARSAFGFLLGVAPGAPATPSRPADGA